MKFRYRIGVGVLLCVLNYVYVAVANDSAANRPAIVLVHGAFQDGPSTWGKVEPKLKERGYKVLVVNLPGRDGDTADPSKLTTQDYQQAVLKVISSEASPVVLVGHSFGGITISNVAEAAPEKIKALVYLSAYLPKDGESLQALSQTDQDSQLGKDGNFVVSADYKYASVKAERAADLFGNDASGSIKASIGKSLIQEPLSPMANPVQLSADRFGKVRKYYIETTRDVVVSPSLQERMLQRAEVQRVFKIDAGHASYVTKANEVAAAILAVAAQ